MTGLRTLLTSRLYTVRGDSMKPSFQPGELLAVGASAHSSSAPARGEIVVVVDPTDGEKQYLKRVVGMPGEEIALADGLLSVNGRRLVEPYLGGLPSSPGLGESVWRLGGEEYFVLGDRRVGSTDSRVFGPITLEHIVGTVWLRLWPPGRWGIV